MNWLEAVAQMAQAVVDQYDEIQRKPNDQEESDKFFTAISNLRVALHEARKERAAGQE
jgi:hypothetical protein